MKFIVLANLNEKKRARVLAKVRKKMLEGDETARLIYSYYIATICRTN
jgi:hypothetical protein